MAKKSNNNHNSQDSKKTTSFSGSSNLLLGKVSAEMQILIDKTIKDQISKEIAVDKASLFTVFGIFASIVTFVSVEIQILKTICDFWNIAGFSLIILSSLLLFVLALDYIGRSWRDDSNVKFPCKVGVFVIIFLVIGFGSAFFGNEEKCKDNSIYQKYQNDFLEKQKEYQKTYENKIENIKQETIKECIRNIELLYPLKNEAIQVK